MTTSEETMMLKKVIRQYGSELQELVAIEEMSELTKAIIKIRRKLKEDAEFFAERDNLIEEIADVEIMIAQLKIIHKCTESVKKKKEQKLTRLWERLGLDNLEKILE